MISNELDLKIAKIKLLTRKNKNIQEENKAVQLDEAEVGETKAIALYKKQLDERNLIRLNGMNYRYEKHSFYDGLVLLDLCQNEFRQLNSVALEDRQLVYFSKDGCYLNLLLSDKLPLFKSIKYYKFVLQEHFKRDELPITWIKENQMDQVKYLIYDTSSKEQHYTIVNFYGFTSNNRVLRGLLCCPKGISNSKIEIFEACLSRIIIL